MFGELTDPDPRFPTHYPLRIVKLHPAMVFMGILATPPPKATFPPEIAGLNKGLLTIGFP